jgi:dephospho-CoA kinase
MTSNGISKPIIGIVGGIGSGKTSVAAEFAGLGCMVLSADDIGHELLDRPDVAEEIRHRWGQVVFADDGKINRTALAKIVFANQTELAALEDILHPHIRTELDRRIQLAQKQDGLKAIVVDAAVLFEAGWDDLCTHTIFVDAPPAARRQRVKLSRGWNAKTLASRENVQIPLDKKAKQCCYTLDNRSNTSHLSERVRRLYHEIIHE